jgi:ABC-2 type transport system ATP-binding protein
MIECKGLRKVYGAHVALQGLDLSLKKGDTFGFIGPNGAGKSTTIRILSTLLEPSAGEAFVGGYSVITEPDEVRKILGYMPDHFGIYDGMRSYEYLEFFAAAYRVPKNQRAKLIADVLEITDLTPKRETFVEGLSTGMKQRLCLAKTLLHDPKVLLLDEPASGLDPRARIELRELIKELARMDKTLCVSSHILHELSDFCNTIGIIEAGQLLASGPVDAILAKTQAKSRRLKIRVLGDSQKTKQLLEGWQFCLQLDVAGDKFNLESNAELEDLCELLDKLVRDGVRPVSFAEQKTDLEDVFLKVTQGIVN